MRKSPVGMKISVLKSVRGLGETGPAGKYRDTEMRIVEDEGSA